MRRAGTVVRSAQGLAIVRCDDDDAPDIGEFVLDSSLDSVGRIVDVFGPVSRPYLAVTPDSGVHVPELLGDTLYLK